MKANRPAFATVMMRAIGNFFRDRCLDHAATVAFYSLLSLGPFLFLVALILRLVLPGGDAAGVVARRMADFLPGEASPMLTRLAKSLPSRESLAVVAIPALLWVTTTAFTALERAINCAFGAESKRLFWLSKLKAFAGASGVTFLLVASVVAGHSLAWLEHHRERLGLPPILGPRASWASYGLQLAIAFVTFTTFFKLLPRGKVHWRNAALAAVVSLVLWEIVRRMFGALLLRSPAFGLLTGALAGIVAFLAWVYAGVAICLYGAEVAAVLNGNR